MVYRSDMTTEMQTYPLPAKYRCLPIGFERVTGAPVTLEQAMAEKPVFETFNDLTPDRRIELVVAVLERREDFKIYALSSKLSEIDRDRAIDEVRRGTEIGQKIVRVEGQMLMKLLHRFLP